MCPGLRVTTACESWLWHVPWKSSLNQSKSPHLQIGVISTITTFLLLCWFSIMKTENAIWKYFVICKALSNVHYWYCPLYLITTLMLLLFPRPVFCLPWDGLWIEVDNDWHFIIPFCFLCTCCLEVHSVKMLGKDPIIFSRAGAKFLFHILQH